MQEGTSGGWSTPRDQPSVVWSCPRLDKALCIRHTALSLLLACLLILTQKASAGSSSIPPRAWCTPAAFRYWAAPPPHPPIPTSLKNFGSIHGGTPVMWATSPNLCDHSPATTHRSSVSPGCSSCCMCQSISTSERHAGISVSQKRQQTFPQKLCFSQNWPLSALFFPLIPFVWQLNQPDNLMVGHCFLPCHSWSPQGTLLVPTRKSTTQDHTGLPRYQPGSADSLPLLSLSAFSQGYQLEMHWRCTGGSLQLLVCCQSESLPLEQICTGSRSHASSPRRTPAFAIVGVLLSHPTDSACTSSGVFGTFRLSHLQSPGEDLVDLSCHPWWCTATFILPQLC